MQPISNTPPQVDEKEETGRRSIPPVLIPATLCVGLLIATIYLGGRIVSARQTSPATKIAVKQATPLPPASVVQPLKVESVKSEAKPELSTSSTKSPDSIPLINPNAGDLYLQLGAMNAEATHRFVQDLRSKNLEPHVAAGPTPGIMRVLLGPFNDRAALDEQKAQLEAQGLSTFVRRY